MILFPDPTDEFRALECDVNDAGHFNPAQKAVVEREKFPCEQCAGTGLYQSPRVHQEKEHCFACKGTGFFYTSKFDRMKKRDQSRARKKSKEEQRIEAFDHANPGVIAFLQGAASWSEFAGQLLQNVHRFGGLTEKQLFSARSMMEKQAIREAERNAARAAEAATWPNLERLAQAFLSSSETLKFPKLRLKTEGGQRVVLSRCGAGSKTPGHINITDGGSYGSGKYFGRISPEGEAIFKGAPQEVIDLLVAFDADPKTEIKAQGIRTGECCCCGRTLTDQVSIQNGIGPICAEKWGF